MQVQTVLSGLIAVTLLAQDPVQPVLRVTTRLVEVNVIVRDKNGPVRGLSKDDFTLFDKGKQRQIAFFGMNVAAANVAAPATADAPGVVRNRPASGTQTPVNVTVVVLDGLNTESRDQQFAKQEFLKYLKQIRPEDRVAVYTLGTKLRVLNDFTGDARRLMAAVNRYTGDVVGLAEAANAAPSDVPDGLGNDKAIQDAINNQMNDLISDHTIRVRAETTAAAMKAIAHHIGHIPGRKSLIWISAGFPFVIGHVGDGQNNSEDTAFDDDISGVTAAKKRGGAAQGSALYGVNDRDGNPARTQMNFTEEARRATQALNDANVSVYPVDARGLTVLPKSMTAEQNYGVSASSAKAPPRTGSNINTGSTAMHVLADSTGGLIFQNTNGIRKAIETAVQDGEVTYTLGFYPDAAALDSTFHNLKIQVKRKDVEVRYRQGYLAAADSKGGLPERTAQVRDALWSPLPATGISLIAGMDKGRLQVAIDPRDITLEKKGDKWIAGLDLVFAQRSNQGAELGLTTTPLGLSLDKAHYDQVLEQGLSITKNVELAASAVEVRVVVVDRASGKIGSLIVPVK
jgi:VWFA-related protein